MDGDSVLDALLAYGADPEVLEEYDCVPRKARVHHDVLKLRMDGGVRCLKKVHLSPSRLQFVFGCTEHVFANKFGDMFVPRMIRTRFGDPFVVHPSGQYYMTAWRAGREADLRKSEELEGAARALGQWHVAAAGFHSADIPRDPTFLERLQRARKQIDQYRSEASTRQTPTLFERLFVSCADELLERVDAANRALMEASCQAQEAKARAEGWICHSSLGRPNVVYDGSTYTLLNYDRVQPGSPVNDLALLLHRYMPAHGWDPEVLARTISAYRSENGSDVVDDGLLRAMLAVPLRTVQAVLWYFNHSRDWEEEDFVDYLKDSLELEEARAAAQDAVSADVPSGWTPLTPATDPQSSNRVPSREPAFRTELSGDSRVSTASAQGLESDVEEGVGIPVHLEETHVEETGGEPPRTVGRARPMSGEGAREVGRNATAVRRRRQAAKRRSGSQGPQLWKNRDS